MLELANVAMRHKLGLVNVPALDGVTLSVAPGEFVALHGKSGSGKTTLLKLIVGLTITPSGGTITVDGRDITKMSRKEADDYRLNTLGIIGAPDALQPGATAIRAASIRLRLSDRKNAEKLVAPLLVQLGLGDRLRHRVEQLSMGERQRVVIALALSTDPRLVLADEPTGNLDTENSRVVLGLLRDLCHERNVALLLATHDPEAAAFADKIVQLRDGHLLHHDPGSQRAELADTGNLR
ncbi:MAG TPA: ABC transporter ATP-binding protein [Solirubrobacteraceae bacterium]|nr:ABC transporter ATP-binding protein [Solirubrobacteraceae bacterium]